jgi:uncharacterized membrane protein YdjX (TVP38/TMEM64 family)
VNPQLSADCEASRTRSARLRRFVPLVLIAAAMIAVFASGAYHQVSLETLVRHRMALDAFISAHTVGAIAAFMVLYIAVVALSIPCGLILTVSGGVLFGAIIGGIAVVISGTIGATIVFLVARSACGETLIRRAGPVAAKLAAGFRDDAFSYLLFLRLIPAFPFFLVNIVPALVGVSLPTFFLATLIGIIPACFAFTFFGAGLDSILATQEQAFRACLASGSSDCTLHFDFHAILTPRLFAGFVALAILALIPVALKWLKRMRARAVHSAPVS